MARGTAVGEPVVSQANTPQFEDGYERTFGPERRPQRGRWVFDPRIQKCVPIDDYVPPTTAVDGAIITGRCHEGMVAPDGTDISTRAKRSAWMKANDMADFDDYKNVRAKAAAEKAAKACGEFKPDKELRDLLGRELYKRKIIL